MTAVSPDKAPGGHRLLLFVPHTSGSMDVPRKRLALASAPRMRCAIELLA